MQITGYVAVGIAGLAAGLFIDEVSLPGVGTLKRDGVEVRADIGDTAYRANDEDLMIMTPGVGFLSKSSSGTQGSLEGLMMGSRSKDSMNFVVASKCRKPRRPGGKLASLAELVFPKKGSVIVAGNAATQEGEQFMQIEIKRATDDVGTATNLLKLILNDEVGGHQAVFIVQDDDVLVVSPRELTSRARLGDSFSYGFKGDK